MKLIFEKLQEQIQKQKDTVLAIVTEGSEGTPRKAGAKMLVNDSGLICGTVGGGNIEYEAICTAKKLLQSKENLLKEYQLVLESEHNIGMMCGGATKILFYYLDGKLSSTYNFVQEGLKRYKEKEAFWLFVPYQDAQITIWDGTQYQIYREKSEATENTGCYVEHMLQEGKVYIFGAGHVAQELAPMLTHLDFRCIIADDRPEFANAKRFQNVEEIHIVDYTRLSDSIHIEQGDYIIIMTRGHACDAACERFALTTKASYIGVMGSKKKAMFIRERLLEEGFTEEELSRITTPIGLSIGSETPQEIAVSIAAQLILVRSKLRKGENK